MTLLRPALPTALRARLVMGLSVAAVSAACVPLDAPESVAPPAAGPTAATSPASAPPATPPPPEAGPAPSAASAPDTNAPSQHAVLLAIAASHDAFYRADGTWWAPFDCRAPPADTGRLSNAAADSAHGRKLYILRIADFPSYARETGRPLGAASRTRSAMAAVVPGASQAVVKVSYAATDDPGAAKGHFITPVALGGKTYYAGEPGDLFIMYRPTASAITDDGWLYGTVSPDGRHVTSAGLVQSCMGCHASAPHGRLFGMRD